MNMKIAICKECGTVITKNDIIKGAEYICECSKCCHPNDTPKEFEIEAIKKNKTKIVIGRISKAKIILDENNINATYNKVNNKVDDGKICAYKVLGYDGNGNAYNLSDDLNKGIYTSIDDGITELEESGKISKDLIEKDEFKEEIYELAFGDNAMNKEYTNKEVIEKVKEFSDDAYDYSEIANELCNPLNRIEYDSDDILNMVKSINECGVHILDNIEDSVHYAIEDASEITNTTNPEDSDIMSKDKIFESIIRETVNDLNRNKDKIFEIMDRYSERNTLYTDAEHAEYGACPNGNNIELPVSKCTGGTYEYCNKCYEKKEDKNNA